MDCKQTRLKYLYNTTMKFSEFQFSDDYYRITIIVQFMSEKYSLFLQ